MLIIKGENGLGPGFESQSAYHSRSPLFLPDLAGFVFLGGGGRKRGASRIGGQKTAETHFLAMKRPKNGGFLSHLRWFLLKIGGP